MSKRKKIVVGLLGTVAVAAVVGILAARVHFLEREEKAIKLAQEYLSQKYEQEMQYKSVRYSWIDPAIYHVTFSPVNIPELSFEVYVHTNLTISPDRTKEFGRYYTSADDYYFAYFNWKMENRFQYDIKKIWSEDATFAVLAMNQGIYGFIIPSALNDQLSLGEMADMIDEYYFYVNTKQVINEDIKLDEAKKICDFIQVVRESGYKPSCLVLYYYSSKSSNNKEGRINISFNDWSEVFTVDQIIEKINAQLVK